MFLEKVKTDREFSKPSNICYNKEEEIKMNELAMAQTFCTYLAYGLLVFTALCIVAYLVTDR